MYNNIKYTWLPAAKANLDSNTLHIVKATGSHLITKDCKQIYDAISSWWCKPLGHCHSLVKESILEQLNYFEHHIPASAYNDVIEELSYYLINIFSSMDKVMYASDGSSAIEIAMKLSYHTRILMGQPERCKFIALAGGYHGETVFALSVCGIDTYKSDYTNLMQQNYFVNDIPYVDSKQDPLWQNCNFDTKKFETLFAQVAPKTTALIIEPIIQGAAGIKIISQDFLIQLVSLAQKFDIHIISDEIMVGLGRLGCYSVSKSFLAIEPEFVCFAKNLTAGAIPMSAVVINRSISSLFHKHNKIFPHSHTHSCNAIAAKIALNYLKFIDSSSLLTQVEENEARLLALMNKLASQFDFILNPRAIGAIAAFDLELEQNIITQIFTIGINHGIYLRPIGSTLYIMPPIYNLTHDLIEISTKLCAVLNFISRLKYAKY